MPARLAHGRDSFEAFYDRHASALRAFVARHLRGRLELDDVMQEGLLRISRDFRAWPREHRLRYAKRTLFCTTYDELRRELGAGSRRERLTFDFATLDTTDVVGLLDRRGREDLQAVGEVIERRALVEVLGALHPEELQVLLGIAHLGRPAPQVAGQLGLTQGRVAYLFDEGRTLARSLLAHARGDCLAGHERLALIELQADRLRGRDRRHWQRHLRHCELCRSIETFERRGASPDDYDGPERRERRAAAPDDYDGPERRGGRG